jgi:hypothetical protein
MIRTKHQEVVEIACRLLEEGIVSGEFRKMDIEQAVMFVEAVIQGFFQGKFWAERKYSIEEETDIIFSFVLRGIEKKRKN